MNKINSDKLIIRPAVADDIEQLLKISTLVGSGMTSMPIDRPSWEYKLARSIADFHNEEPEKAGDTYFMVMVDTSSEQIVGCCAVYAGVGIHRPFYSYKLSTITAASEKLDLTISTRLLSLVNDYTGSTEIGSLFLLPEYRVDGIGKVLSRSRFLLLADFPERFDEVVFAEMRGWLDENDNSPFWQHLGHKFFGISFQKADFISAVDGFQFISDLMPKYPVYLDLLPEEAQDVVGKPHRDAAGALKILQREGFQHTGYVDIFDGGPSIQTPLTQIKTVADSRITTLAKFLNAKDAPAEDAGNFICSNTRLSDYRIMRTKLVELENNQVALTEESAKTLNLNIGDEIRVVKE